MKKTKLEIDSNAQATKSDDKIEMSSEERLIELVEAYKNGSESAFEAIHKMYNSYIRTMVFNDSRIPAEAKEDALQDVWMRLTLALKTFDPSKGIFKSFIVTCAKNEIGQSWREGKYGNTLSGVTRGKTNINLKLNDAGLPKISSIPQEEYAMAEKKAGLEKGTLMNIVNASLARLDAAVGGDESDATLGDFRQDSQNIQLEYEKEETIREMREYIATLPEKRRRVLTLICEGVPEAEVAKIIKKTTSDVKFIEARFAKEYGDRIRAKSR